MLEPFRDNLKITINIEGCVLMLEPFSDDLKNRVNIERLGLVL